MNEEYENASKQRYLNAVNELSKDNSCYVDKITKESCDTKYAIAYLVSNLDSIKLKCSSHCTGNRNNVIVNHIKNKFPYADTNKIVRFLNRKRILTNEMFFILNILLHTILNALIYWNIISRFNILNDDSSIENFIVISIIVNVASVIFFQLLYAEGTFIKLYRINLKKIINNT